MISAVVNIIVMIALYNPFTFATTLVVIPRLVNDFEIVNEVDFDQCSEDMGIDFGRFPEHNEFSEQDVRFVGKVDAGFFYYQSITAIVKYSTVEACEADYNAYIDTHQFLTEPVVEFDDYCLISAPEFIYK